MLVRLVFLHGKDVALEFQQLVSKVSKNQNQILKTLNASGLETNLKRTDKSLLLNLKEIFKNIYKNQNYLREMTLCSYSLCDGNGVTKVGMLSLNFFNEFHKDRISFQIFNKELHINDEKFTTYYVFFKKNLVGFLKISFNLIQKKIRIIYNLDKNYFSLKKIIILKLENLFSNFEITSKNK